MEVLVWDNVVGVTDMAHDYLDFGPSPQILDEHLKVGEVEKATTLGISTLK